MWQDFMAQNPDWFVIFNEENQLPHRAFGTPISLNNTGNIISFLASSNFNLPNDLRESAITKNDKYINLSYSQYYNSLEVINSQLFAKFTLNNELVSFGLDLFNDISISTIPSFSAADAIDFASNGITSDIIESSVESALKILPNPDYRKYNYHLVLIIVLEFLLLKKILNQILQLK